jgi:hypothetical protein
LSPLISAFNILLHTVHTHLYKLEVLLFSKTKEDENSCENTRKLHQNCKKTKEK